jgi:CheY-like chemotaxis protein
VLLNLFVNASDAMPGGGKLFLKTDTVTHREIPCKGYTIHTGPYVRLTVADTGVGIDKEIIDRIFDPFFTTKKMGRGTGLGLASAYGIVKGHHGYIDVVSEKGQGSTFFVYFPATDARPAAAAEKSGKPEEGFGTILLVDDEAVVLDVTAAMLRRLGYTVLTARSGREAVESYTEHADRISAVVLDMIMPEMGGGEVFDQLKRINPSVKVLLASGYSMQGQAREIMNRGCDGFLQKPFTLEDFSLRVQSLISRS